MRKFFFVAGVYIRIMGFLELAYILIQRSGKFVF
jgi:hypothetical protein